MKKILNIDKTIFSVFFKYTEIPERFKSVNPVFNYNDSTTYYVVNYYMANVIFNLLSKQLGCLSSDINQHFLDLSQHKHKIFFGFTITQNNKLSLSSVIYDTPSENLGILHAKKLKRLIYDFGFGLPTMVKTRKRIKKDVAVFYFS